MRVGYFGTWERGYPRNEQVIAALRAAGLDVTLYHEDLEVGEHKFALGPAILPTLLRAEARLAIRRIDDSVDALLVGYPGYFDIWAAKRHRRPVVFNAMVSLYDTFVGDRRRFAANSLAARTLRVIDRAALRGAARVVADTEANAAYLAEYAGIAKPAVCYVGAEERLFTRQWRRPERFSALFVGKLIPLHGLEVILEAARILPDVHFRLIGSGQLEGLLRHRSPNVDHLPWVEYSQLPGEYARAGCALGVFGKTAKARRVIPNKVFQALAVGAPLVTAATEGVAELLHDGRDALLIEPSPEALADAIRRLRDPELAERIGYEGRRTFEREASERVLGGRWREVIAGVTS
jgi:glycosyltransferase involved in cell wall biosynthesis